MLENKFTEALLLAYPDRNQEIWLNVDASGIAVEAVLSVKCNDGNWRPYTFLSHLFNVAERNYPIYDKELPTVISTLEE